MCALVSLQAEHDKGPDAIFLGMVASAQRVVWSRVVREVFTNSVFFSVLASWPLAFDIRERKVCASIERSFGKMKPRRKQKRIGRNRFQIERWATSCLIYSCRITWLLKLSTAVGRRRGSRGRVGSGLRPAAGSRTPDVDLAGTDISHTDLAPSAF